LMPRNIAARAKLPVSATATKNCNSSSSVDACPIPKWGRPSELRRDSASAKAGLRHRSFTFRGLMHD
jgi:hypothetical protein